MATCIDCNWWRNVGEQEGECRRYPPVVVADGEGKAWAEWPDTFANSWCGEFRYKHSVKSLPHAYDNILVLGDDKGPYPDGKK